MKLDLDELTIGELMIFEDTTGKPIGAIGKNPGARDLQALALIFLRRENPEATLEDAAAVKVSAFSSMDENGVDPIGATDTDS